MFAKDGVQIYLKRAKKMVGETIEMTDATFALYKRVEAVFFMVRHKDERTFGTMAQVGVGLIKFPEYHLAPVDVERELQRPSTDDESESSDGQRRQSQGNRGMWPVV